MATLEQAKRVADRCGVAAELDGDRLNLYLPHDRLDMMIHVATIFLDSKDGKWTAASVRPGMTGTPMGEHIVGFNSLDEAIIVTMLEWFGKEAELRSLGLVSDR